MSKLSSFLIKLAKVSPYKLWYVISNPQMIPVRLTLPLPLSSIDATLSLFPNLMRTAVEDCRLELLRNISFFSEIDRKMVEKRKRRADWREWYEFLYMIVRFSKPELIIETGVFDGQSSAIVLLALAANNYGNLVSIDLPAYESIEGSTHMMPEGRLPFGYQPGWLIPHYLKEKHRLILGDTKEILPALLSKEYPKIDIFFHDSLHTFEHMYFEYMTAWPYLKEGGILVSDDIFWNAAFHKFCREQHRSYWYVGNCGFGVTRK